MKSSYTILIVDDIPRNIQLVVQHLKILKHRMIYATSGEKALQLLADNEIDLVLMDVMMPGMDGFECCRLIRNNPLWKDIPVIFLTARNEVQDIIKGFESGGSDYVTKPFYGQELLARVNTLLDLKINRDILEKRETQLKEMLHILSHDLRNSLSGISMLLDLAELETRPLDQYKERFKDLSSNGLNLIDLVRTMLILEEKPLPLEAVNLGNCINHCVYLLQTKMEAKKISIEKKCGEDLMILAEETSLINSVLMNILTNAIKFSFPEGVIILKVHRRDNAVILTLRDQGAGIPEEIIPNLFDVEKAKSTNGTEGEKGSGFGMPLVYKFMKAYKGEVTIARAAPGTIVTLRFREVPPSD